MRFFLNAVLILLSICHSVCADSWHTAQETKQAELDLHWHTSKPFIQFDSNDNLIGLEYDLIMAFADFLSKEHGIELKLNWIEARDFHHILDSVQFSKAENAMGVSAFSITKERQQYLKFTDTYLPDITVLVSSQGTPIVRNFNEIHHMMEGMQAITIRGTIYESLLLKMKDQIHVDFEILYIDSDDNVLRHISESDNMFGFIDLPIYLMWIRDGRNLIRQNFFTIRGMGYGLILPQHSDWDIPFNQFLSDEKYKKRVNQIISNYLGEELMQFIEGSYDSEQLDTDILTMEKEIQLALIKNANLNLEQEIAFKRLFIAGFGGILLSLIIIVYYFRKNQKKTQLILEQKNQIENHQNDIRQKNDQLINRNAQLLALNEEKNNLVNILAHDLRSPLNHIQSLSQLLENSNSNRSDDEKDFLDKISESASRMNHMISKILDVDTLDRDQNTVLKEHVDVHQLLQDLSIRYQPLATNKNIELVVKAHDESLQLETDHMLLFLVLENLLSNAVKFSDPGSKVELAVSKDEDQLIFEVSDQGPGFTDEDKKMLFTRFKKLSAQPTGGESSTGLGLSIVKKYVSDLGGEVWLETEAGKGSTFFVSLKIAQLTEQ